MIDTSAFQGKIASYYTPGRKLDFSEASTFGETLQELGVRTVDRGERADIYLINTCPVTEVADHKYRQAIRRMVRESPGAFIIVTGCYAQLESETVSKVPGVDLVLGSNEKAHLVQYLNDAWLHRNALREQEDEVTDGLHAFQSVKTKDIKTLQPSCLKGNRTRYFLKVQNGYNHFCTCCTIPFACGFSRNPSVASLVQRAEQVAEEGGRGITLTGVNTGEFGERTDETFLDLVEALDQVEGIRRLRISSLEPDLMADELIDYCAQSKAFMPHFYTPLQSGSDEVFKLMHRHYDTSLFANKAHHTKEMIPHVFIDVDVMVGCRGEKPEYFEESYEFVRSLDVTQLHVFPYPERPGTCALSIPYVVSEHDKKLRSKRLLQLPDEKTHAFYVKYVEQKVEVLFEKVNRSRAMYGFTRNYICVEMPIVLAKGEFDN